MFNIDLSAQPKPEFSDVEILRNKVAQLERLAAQSPDDVEVRDALASFRAEVAAAEAK